jgi:putative heme-binding domain-containing protein
VRDRALGLAVLFNDPQALAALDRTLLDTGAASGDRHRALQLLLTKQKADLLPRLRGLLGDAVVRGAVIRALAAFDDGGTPALLLKQYASFTDAEKADAVATLASRAGHARALLDAVDRGTIPRRDVSAFTLRQLAGLKDRDLNERIARVWGIVRSTSKERAAQIKQYRGMLTPEEVKQADRSHGRAVYVRQCAACHRLFDAGDNVGPELTGSQRTSLDYILENVLDPSAVVAREYQVTVLELKSGRVLNGIIKEETERALTLRTQNETVVVPKGEIESREAVPVSMMPEGLFDKLTREEVRDLIGYLAGPEQVSLPPAAPAPERK